MIQEILKKSKDTKVVIGIRRYNNDENFWCGFIEDYNDTIIQIRHFDEYGNNDGIIIEQIENIESIDLDSEYVKTFNFITRNKNNFDHLQNISVFYNTDKWRYDYLNDSKEMQSIISLEFNRDFVIYGIIIELNDQEFIIEGIGKLGEVEGKTIYKMENISSIKIFDNDCRFRNELYNWRTKSSRQ